MTVVAEGDAMRYEPTPSTCPICGKDQVRRILWGWVCLSTRARGDVEAGRAILGRRRRDASRGGRGADEDPDEPLDAPGWACLHCQPGWLNVHRMAVEVDELQLAKEKAIQAHEFEEAAAILNRQDGIDDRLTELARRLIGE
jgi:hypothetical protein